MKSGLGDRNNHGFIIPIDLHLQVSMKSGLGDRNNNESTMSVSSFQGCLNEVRS